ncbi:hypothetical protein PCASD_15794 [Puccinia coronata f. sp. avenae]|uniref:Uncharacterized protein n=1 Tax=Puccinia coronata f. sp. avenae TaxID=200324 RepID=A0A2N5TTT3_9BASI|nr:hypothetical protein PCASD_25276 [Puccinia coronata f. sp. avenae]PLW28900.1 hypothetical protein PCASD_15794 [Puccinia coronata f. sp. avenae]
MEFGLKPGLEEIILQCRGIKFIRLDQPGKTCHPNWEVAPHARTPTGVDSSLL